MAKPRNKWVDLAQYGLLRLIHMTMHAWPISLNLLIARGIGDLLFCLDAKHRKRALANLARSFPDMPESVRRRHARESMRQLLCLFVEVIFTPRLIRLESFAKYIQLNRFEQTLRLMLTPGRGLILLTGHYGNWEVLGYVLATLGFETTSVARPLDNPYINAFLLGVREKQGQRIIAKKGATDDVTETLERGGMVAFIADQDAGKKGMFVDFFGRKASTYKSIGLLAMRYEVPVVIGYARRVGDFRFACGTQDIIYPEDWKNEADPLRYITQRYTKAIEDSIRADPGQYLWVHRRWKTRPKGEPAETYD